MKNIITNNAVIVAIVGVLVIGGLAYAYSANPGGLQGKFPPGTVFPPGFTCDMKTSSIVVSEVTSKVNSKVTSKVNSKVTTTKPTKHTTLVPSDVTSDVPSDVPSWVPKCVVKRMRPPSI